MDEVGVFTQHTLISSTDCGGDGIVIIRGKIRFGMAAHGRSIHLKGVDGRPLAAELLT